MANYNVVRTDRMTGTQVNSQLRSFKYNGNLENGSVVRLKELISGEREIYQAVDPAANTPIAEVVLTASPEYMYDERMRNLTAFINKEGEPCRGYKFVTGDTFGVTKDCFTATNPAIGNVVELTSGTKFGAVATLTGGSTQIGKIVAIETENSITYYVVEVL